MNKKILESRIELLEIELESIKIDLESQYKIQDSAHRVISQMQLIIQFLNVVTGIIFVELLNYSGIQWLLSIIGYFIFTYLVFYWIGRHVFKDE